MSIVCEFCKGFRTTEFDFMQAIFWRESMFLLKQKCFWEIYEKPFNFPFNFLLNFSSIKYYNPKKPDEIFQTNGVIKIEQLTLTAFFF